jgi:hypothetical protein
MTLYFFLITWSIGGIGAFSHVITWKTNRIRVPPYYIWIGNVFHILTVKPSQILSSIWKGFHVKCPLFASSFPLILSKLEFDRQVLVKIPVTILHENLSSGDRVVPCGRTDRHDEADSHFSKILLTSLVMVCETPRWSAVAAVVLILEVPGFRPLQELHWLFFLCVPQCNRVSGESVGSTSNKAKLLSSLCFAIVFCCHNV